MAACRHCGSELPEAARFCPSCGVSVAAHRGEERKVVTVLFADLADSTAQADGRDPEDVRAAVRPQVTRMREELERFGGTFEKYVGDAVMAVFGAPVAHEDDPERAVRAALAIRDALPGVRVAVATGEAVVSLAATPGTGEGIATGDVVNTAFRIEETAETGTVLVGESTYRATESAIDYGPRRLLQARGKQSPVAVYEALSALSDFPVSYEGRALAPLIGRKEELRLIIDTIARARRDRTVQLVTLVGVPGIGKSRLVWELQRAVEDEPGLVTWRRGRCLPYGDGVTFWALGEMVKAQAGILESDPADTAETKLGRAVRDLIADGRQATWVENHLRRLITLEAPPGERSEDAFAAWRRFFEALAEWGPLVLAFEDLHWADSGLLDFLDHLADWAKGVPIVLLCTARPELLERRSSWGARANAATIALPPLNSSETDTLVGHLLRQSLVPLELRDALVERAEGNPLYAEEFVRMLVDRGLLYRVRGDWRVKTTEFPLPESVQGIIASRVDALQLDEKTALRDAAVIGRGFWPAAVAAVSGLEREAVDAALFSLERKELVRRLSSSSIASELQYSFHHAVVRDVAYSSIPRVERAEKHRLAAEWIDSLGRREDHAETIAHHYLSALEYARGAHQPTDRFAEQAREALRAAGDRALGLNAPDIAARYFAGALELTADDAKERARLLFLRAKSLYRTGHPDEDLLEEARRACLEVGDVERAAECQAILGDVRWRQGDHVGAFEQLEEAIDGLAKPSYAKAYALAELARMRNAADQPRTAIALGHEALAIADELDLRELRVSVLTTTGIARTLTGDDGGIDDLRRSVEAAEEIASPESVRAYYNLGAMLGISGQLLASFDALAEGRRMAERFGDAAWIAWYEAERLYEQYWRGAWDDALELADRVVDASDGTVPASVEFDAAHVRAWIALARGDNDEALANIRRAHAFAREARDPQILYPALALRARATAELLGEDEAAGYVDELVERFTKQPSPPMYWVVDLAIASSRLQRGASALEPIRTSAPSTRWLEAALAMVGGDFRRAADLFIEIGARPEEAYCLLAAAAVGRRDGSGQRSDGVATALAFYRSVGASAYARAAEALLEARGTS
jgi:class 3 adenylate cyclase/tetratricopeptide (TPR) repeat protein